MSRISCINDHVQQPQPRILRHGAILLSAEAQEILVHVLQRGIVASLTNAQLLRPPSRDSNVERPLSAELDIEQHDAHRRIP